MTLFDMGTFSLRAIIYFLTSVIAVSAALDSSGLSSIIYCCSIVSSFVCDIILFSKNGRKYQTWSIITVSALLVLNTLIMFKDVSLNRIMDMWGFFLLIELMLFLCLLIPIVARMPIMQCNKKRIDLSSCRKTRIACLGLFVLTIVFTLAGTLSSRHYLSITIMHSLMVAGSMAASFSWIRKKQ